jgi:hypothetical protein
MSYDTKKCALTVAIDIPHEDSRVSLREAQDASPRLYACDGVAFVPLWFTDGPGEHTHQRAVTMGPDGQPLTDAQLWQVWSLLATDLASRPGLSPALRNLCRIVDNLISSSLAKAAPVPPEGEPRKETFNGR